MPALSSVMKDIFFLTLKFNLTLKTLFVPSRENPANLPSRSLSDADCKLSPLAWKLVDQAFGPHGHSLDLMALSSNVQCDSKGQPLRFFSPFPNLRSSGTNHFSQVLGALLSSAQNAVTQTITIFSLCQRCGYWRIFRSQQIVDSKIQLGLSSINNRLQSIHALRASKPYKKLKSALQKALENFVFSLPLSKSLFSAAPQDLVRFLIWKIRKGKTKVHKSACSLFGSHSKEHCQCPVRLAAGTVDILVGKLRSIFNNVGRDGPWCDLLGTSNPASHQSLKD